MTVVAAVFPFFLLFSHFHVHIVPTIFCSLACFYVLLIKNKENGMREEKLRWNILSEWSDKITTAHCTTGMVLGTGMAVSGHGDDEYACRLLFSLLIHIRIRASCDSWPVFSAKIYFFFRIKENVCVCCRRRYVPQRARNENIWMNKLLPLIVRIF